MLQRLLLVTLLLLSFTACAEKAPAKSASAQPAEGEDYVVLTNGTRWSNDDKIEVAEVFAYTCHHCANFQPLIENWKHRQAKDVRISYVAAGYNVNDAYGKAYYASEQLGIMPRSHSDVFIALHNKGELPASNPSDSELASFYQRYNVSADKFIAALNSPQVKQSMQRSHDFMIKNGVEYTPTLVINGKYRVTSTSLEGRLKTADFLIAKERAAAKAK